MIRSTCAPQRVAPSLQRLAAARRAALAGHGAAGSAGAYVAAARRRSAALSRAAAVAVAGVLSAAVVAAALPPDAAAQEKPAKAPPAARKGPEAVGQPPMVVVRGAKRIGSEALLSKTGAANRYHSTKARLTDGGRSFTQRAHLVLDDKGMLQTYDRWIDVKGATLRLRVFQVEGKWRQVLFGQPGEKNEVAELAIMGTPVIFDERSPVVNGLAAVLAGQRDAVPYVRADETTAGEATVRREALADAAGKRFVRTTFATKKWTIAVVRDGAGAIVHVAGPGPLGGMVAGFDVKKLVAAPEATAAPDVPPPPAPPPANDDAPVAPPRDDPQTP